MKFKDIIKQGTSAFLTFGGFVATTSILFEGGNLEPVALILGGLTPMIGGGIALHHFRKQHQLEQSQELEQHVLELFTVYQGQMSLAQMAMALKLPIETIEEEMNRLQSKGVLEINLTENGAVVYKIPQLSPQEKDILLK